MKKNIIFIKLGGSTITDKNTTKTANYENIRQLVSEIKRARSKTKDLVIIGHGQGSFAHRSAYQYKTKEGLVRKDSGIGLAKVRQDCIELNLIIIQEFIKAGLPAITIEPFAFLTTKNKKVDQIFLQPFLNTLERNLIPVIYGDPISDSKIGCTIYSGETTLNILARKLQEKGYGTRLVIEVGKTDGVYDEEGKTIEKISFENWKQIKRLLSGSESVDVTGGMLHKVEEAYELAREKIPTLLISADQGNLYKAILGKKVKGTFIN